MPSTHPVLPLLLAGVLATGTAAQSAPGLQLTAEQRELFLVLDQLVDTAACTQPFVRTSLGAGAYGGHQRDNVVRYGFLLAATDAQLEVRFIEGDRAVLAPTRPDPELERIG